MTMNFGPLSAQKGERRLNVLISRARKRCEVFSSITGDDINLAETTGHGPRAIQDVLEVRANRAAGNGGDSAT